MVRDMVSVNTWREKQFPKIGSEQGELEATGYKI